MITRQTIRNGLYAAVGIIILTLTGIFETFSGRVVIDGVLDLDTVTLILMLGGTGFVTALAARDKGPLPIVANGIAGSTIVAIALTLLVIVDININMRFVFPNLTSLNSGTLTFDREIIPDEGSYGPLLLLLGAGLLSGGLIGVLAVLKAELRSIALISAGLTAVLGLTVGQINTIITLPDAIVLMFMFVMTYIIGWRYEGPLNQHLLRGFASGVIFAAILVLVANNGGLDDGGILRGTSDPPQMLSLATNGNAVFFVLLVGILGAAGALVSGAPSLLHNSVIYFFCGLLVLGIINWQESMSLLGSILVFGVLMAAFHFVPSLGEHTETSFSEVPPGEQRTVYGIMLVAGAIMLFFAPQFMGLYITNVFNLIVLYAIMGLGLNVMIGFTGLLDLGYVASFAIGAYTLGILTTPNILTCGGTHPSDIPFDQLATACTGTMTFWEAWPLCVLVSALTGMMLGIPVLRLRGDYLAIVTLGFGEITNRIIKSNAAKPLLGAAQGITPIPNPVIDLTAINEDWLITFNNSETFYYLFLIAIGITIYVIYRLANSRTGRAWRAVRADEDVAQAMGIDLMQTKLLAFGISSAFAGLGGAVFGAMLQGIFPNSFTLMVSINVLSLIIIGGMGSIPGVIIGAMLLIGLPELLRELETYRLLAFGTLLVVVMLSKPGGLMPPKPRRYAELAAKATAEKETSHV